MPAESRRSGPVTSSRCDKSTVASASRWSDVPAATNNVDIAVVSGTIDMATVYVAHDTRLDRIVAVKHSPSAASVISISWRPASS